MGTQDIDRDAGMGMREVGTQELGVQELGDARAPARWFPPSGRDLVAVVAAALTCLLQLGGLSYAFLQPFS